MAVVTGHSQKVITAAHKACRTHTATCGYVVGTSRPVSRVLYQPRRARDGHPSRATVAGDLVRSTPELGRAALRRSGRKAGAFPFDLAPGGVCRAVRVTPDAGALLPHRFTLTGEPPEGRSPAVCFLWHFPAGHPGSVLPITLPYGARTFLDPTHPQAGRAATVRPTRPHATIRAATRSGDGCRSGSGPRPARRCTSRPRTGRPGPGASGRARSVAHRARSAAAS